MQNHTKIYFEAFGYDTQDATQFVPSEISKLKAVDIHHIIGRGKKGEDRIENLMAVTRIEHIEYGDKKEFMVLLLKIHRRILQINKIPFDNNWFEEKIKQYDGTYRN